MTASGQTVNGAAEWTVARGTTGSTGSDEDHNNSFWQRYSVEFDSHLLDPRLLKYNAQASLLTDSLTFMQEKLGADPGIRKNPGQIPPYNPA